MASDQSGIHPRGRGRIPAAPEHHQQRDASGTDGSGDADCDEYHGQSTTLNQRRSHAAILTRV